MICERYVLKPYLDQSFSNLKYSSLKEKVTETPIRNCRCPSNFLPSRLWKFQGIYTQGIQHCVKSVRVWSYSGPFFPTFGLNTERYSASLRIQSECRKKIRTWITANTDTFYAVQFIVTLDSRNEVFREVTNIFIL